MLDVFTRHIKDLTYDQNLVSFVNYSDFRRVGHVERTEENMIPWRVTQGRTKEYHGHDSRTLERIQESF